MENLILPVLVIAYVANYWVGAFIWDLILKVFKIRLILNCNIASV
jgi:hypothetical protein